MFRRLGRVSRTAVIAGLLIASAGGAAVIGGSHGAAAAAGSANTAPAAPGGPRHGHKGQWGGPGALGRGIFGRRMAPVLKVTSVSGSTINATAVNGRAVTVTVSATTAYTEAGATASLSDVQSGTVIRVRGTRNSQTSIQARAVVIVLPRMAGVVTKIDGSTLTVEGRDALPHTVTVTSGTRYVRGGQTTASLSDVAVGSEIVVEGKLNSDRSLSAVRIGIRLPHVGGKVTAVNGSSITVGNVWGQTYTVNVSSSTTYSAPGGVSASLSSVTVGERIMAVGTMGSDNTTINATRVVIMPARGLMGPRGGFAQGAGAASQFGASTGV